MESNITNKKIYVDIPLPWIWTKSKVTAFEFGGCAVPKIRYHGLTGWGVRFKINCRDLYLIRQSLSSITYTTQRKDGRSFATCALLRLSSSMKYEYSINRWHTLNDPLSKRPRRGARTVGCCKYFYPTTFIINRRSMVCGRDKVWWVSMFRWRMRVDLNLSLRVYGRIKCKSYT